MSQQHQTEQLNCLRAEPGSEAAEASPGDAADKLCDAAKTATVQPPSERAAHAEAKTESLQPARVEHSRILKRIGVPEVGRVCFGDFRNVSPISQSYGLDRGRPIDRYYIEDFLASEGGSITGRVLEVGDDTYTRKFGVNIIHSDVLNLHPGIEGTTLVADLADGRELESNSFDCVIVTQTLNLIYDIRSAVRTMHRILKPNGVMLCTVPGNFQIAYEGWNESWYWGMTVNSAARLAYDVFDRDRVTVASRGNVLSAIGFLQGLADTELTVSELDAQDPAYQLIILIKAQKMPPA